MHGEPKYVDWIMGVVLLAFACLIFLRRALSRRTKLWINAALLCLIVAMGWRLFVMGFLLALAYACPAGG